MPPIRNKIKKQNQPSVKEMLLSKKAVSPKATAAPPVELLNSECEDDEDVIVLPRIFSKFTDIRPPEVKDGLVVDSLYHCSTFARVWFREHSNFEEILEEHMKRDSAKAYPKNSHTSAVMRAVTSAPLRRLQAPYSKFRFHSPAEEIIGRTLLINPYIRTREDLNEFEKFQNKHRLRLVGISIFKENQVHEDAKQFIEEKQHKHFLPTQIPEFSKRQQHFRIKRRYYEREDLVTTVYLKDLNVQQLEAISNFKHACEKMMHEDESPAAYETYSKITLQVFKNCPLVRLGCSHFAVEPQYNLICNNMTDQQQSEAAESYRNFYDFTNARQIQKRLGDRTTKQEFFERYRTRDHDGRKLPPYHNLFYIPAAELTINEQMSCNLNDDMQENFRPPSAISESQGPSHNSTMVEQLRRKPNQRFEKKDDRTTTSIDVEDENSSAASVITVLRTQSTSVDSAPEPPPALALPEVYLNEHLKPSPSARALMTVLLLETVFVSQVRRTLGAAYSLNFDALWKEKRKFILLNFISRHLENGTEKLSEIIAKCPPRLQEQAKRLIEAHRKAIEGTTVVTEEIQDAVVTRAESPSKTKSPASSTANVSQVKSPAKEPNEKLSHTSDVIMTSDNIPVAHVQPTIKTEPMSPPMYFTESSEVLCLGTLVAQEIILSDSQDADVSLIASLQDRAPVNSFLQLINQDTQPNEGEVNLSESFLAKVRPYEPITVRHLRQDKLDKQSKAAKQDNAENEPTTTTKRRSTRQRPGPKSKTRNAASRPGDMKYLSDESSPSDPGNEGSADHVQDVLNDDFSVFLSSELLIGQIEAEDDAIEAPAAQQSNITFAKPSSSLNFIAAPPITVCFLVELRRVVFEKNVLFELHVNLPQYSLYDTIVDSASIQPFLDVNDDVFSSIMHLLSVIGIYNFTVGEKRQPTADPGLNTIISQLDLFFSTQTMFKDFQLHVENDQIKCHNEGNVRANNVDLTTAIAPNILKALKESSMTTANRRGLKRKA